MSLINEIPEIVKHIKDHEEEIGFNEKVFEILEGNLLEQVKESLYEQLSPSSYKTAIERVAPINLFKKVVNKLSTLYVEDPVRKTDIESDQELVDHYTEELSINSFMEDLNKGFNAYKWSVIELYGDDYIEPRVLPSHMFLPYSNDSKNPTRVTAVIKFMGEYKGFDGKIKNKYHVISADEFISIDDEGNLFLEDMEENEGVNEYGVIPYVFVSKSRYLLVPMPDKDDLKMSILFPVLMTDLNFAAKFMAHGIYYGVDIDSDNLQISPDAFWNFKSDDEGKTPQVGTIKSDISIDGVLTLAREQIAAWLDTKNIKVGSIGKISGDNAASGISKMVDEADTTMERKAQAKFFQRVELELWRVLAQMHNVKVEARQITGLGTFSDPKKLKVSVAYKEQKPVMSRKEKIDELKAEVDAGFKSKRRAIEELNPHEEIDQMIEEIENEGAIFVRQELDLSNNQGQQEV